MPRRPDRKHALSVSEARYKTMVETMGDGLSEIDEHQITTYANDTLCRMWKRSRQEIIGIPVPLRSGPGPMNAGISPFSDAMALDQEDGPGR